MSARDVQPLSVERLAEIRAHVAGIRNWSLGNLAARDLLAEVDRLLAERHVTNEALDDAVRELRARRDDEPSGSYPPALPWARLMDHEDLADFLDELAAAAIANVDAGAALAEVEKACGTWRLIAEAQYGYNTAPGPDVMTRTFAPVQALRERPGEFEATLHHGYAKGRDLPETGGAR